MKNDLISIITPVYNAEQTLVQTIQSTISQTYHQWELLLVDDCSTDNSWNIMNTYAKSDPRVRIFSMEKNSGPAKTRNKAIENALGRFICFLDADDLWLPNKLQTQLSTMLNKNFHFTYTLYRRINYENTRTGSLMPAPESLTYNSLLKNTAIATSTVMIDRQKFPIISMRSDVGYDDFVLWLSLLKEGTSAYLIKEDLMRYRISPKSVSRNKLRSMLRVWDIYIRVEKLSLPKALFCLINYSVRAFIKTFLI